MNYVHDFNGFLNESLNEGKDWNDFSAKEIADLFMKDYVPKEQPTGEDLDQWLSIFAQDKKIEDGIDSSFAFLKKVANTLSLPPPIAAVMSPKLFPSFKLDSFKNPLKSCT